MTAAAAPTWLQALRTYLLGVTLLHAVWELLQLPLYAIWSTGTGPAIAYALLHCTAGDLLIAASALLAALLVAGTGHWPRSRFGTVAVVTILVGICFTIYSEWRNTTVTGAWTYAPGMPTLFGIGLSPVAQWLFVPGLALWWTRRRLAALEVAHGH